jgi:hypothetical protein
MIEGLEASGGKAIHTILDLDTAMFGIYSFEHAYIVQDAYLVMFVLGVPWYSTDLVLSEQLVLALRPSKDFSVVPRFLEQAGREAGARLAEAGTALAKSDRALASLYERSGFTVEAFALTKEL